MSTAQKEICGWCHPPTRRRTANSEWEQKNLRGEWLRLCNRCANRRLNNPYNALLNMRKISKDSKGEAI